MSFDLLIRGATLIGPGAPAGGGVGDVAVRSGRIAAVGDLGAAQATRVVEASGLYLSAGWIDLHAHLWGPDGRQLDADREAGVSTGVTTVVDAGSFGAAAYAEFAARVAAPAATRVLAFLSVSVDTARTPRHGHADNLDTDRTVATLEQDGGRLLVGVKVQASRSHCGALGAAPVTMAAQAARLSGSRVMSHVGNAPPTLDEVLSRLAAGDVVTHAWHGKAGGVVDRAGRPVPAVLEALGRGIRFDLGHGSASFAFRTARAALAAGLPLDAISTDLHVPNQACGPVYDLATTQSKLLALGWSLAEVVDRVTAGPAAILGRSRDLGLLAVGRDADLTLFELRSGPVRLVDAEGEAVLAPRRIVPRMAVRAGRVTECRDAWALAQAGDGIGSRAAQENRPT